MSLPAGCARLAAWSPAGPLLVLALLAGCREPARSLPPAAAPAGGLATSPAQPAGPEERALDLAAGASITAPISGGGAHAYSFDLAAGWYADLAVDQLGSDVVLRLSGPDGRPRCVVDSPNGPRGAEPLPVVGDPPGRYRVEVRAAGGAAGRYRLRVAALRPATAADRARVAAERTFAATEELRRAGTDLAAAAVLGGEALHRFRALGDRRRQADALYALGRIDLARGERAAAVPRLRQALDLFQALAAQRATGRTLNSLAHALTGSGAPAEALAYARASVALNRRLGDPGGEAAAHNNAGRALQSLGDFEAALASYEAALDLWHRHGLASEEGTTLSNMARLYLLLGEPELAEDLLRRAVPLLAAAGREREEAVALTRLGMAEGKAGQPRRGLALLRRALGLLRPRGDPREEAVTLNEIGSLHLQLGEAAAARPPLLAARAAFRTLGDVAGEATVLNNLGWLHLELGEGRQAAGLLGQALPLLASAGDRQGEAAAQLGLARARRSLGDLAGARTAAEAALEQVERLHGGTAGHRLRSSFLAARQDYYGLYVDLLLDLDRAEPAAGHAARALEAAERGRARALLDMLADAGADLRRDGDPALVAREAELARRLAAAERSRQLLLDEGAPAAELARAESELRRLLDAYERAHGLLHRASPRAAALAGFAAFADHRPVTVAELQRTLLGRDTLLLEYALGAERSALWAVTSRDLAVFTLPPRAVIEETARRAHTLLAASHQTLARAEANVALEELSRLLLAPLAGRLDRQRLLVVGDGALLYVPFGALPDPQSGAPLLARHEVVSLPSAAVLAALRRARPRRREEQPRHTLAVLADPVFDPADPRLDQSGAGPGAAPQRSVQPAARTAGSWPRLPFSRAEAAAITALVPAAERLVALDFAANRDLVLGGGLGKYRIVHFATHGVLDASRPELSGLVLSLVDTRGRPRDGYLRSHEIYGLDLPADLVVLSACETALGKEVRGEGLVGLSRGFLHAGARRVLMSLWPVEDRATAELMRRFYHGMLRQGRSPGVALRAAQESLQREPGWGAPYYWAGFVLQGDPD